MSPLLISMGIAALATIGLVVTLGVLSLVSGGVHFFLAKPRLEVLKSQFGESGFAFGMKWNSAMEPAKFDKVKVRLFNPFGSPTQVEVSKEFTGFDHSSATDVDMGPGMERLLSANGLKDATIQVEVSSSSENINHQFDMRAEKFMAKRNSALESASKFQEDNALSKDKALYQTVRRSFISDPLPKSNKALKLATNPEFAGEFAGAGGGASDTPQENFAVSKVWIDPGCIVCDACEAIFPEVFEVTDSTCVIRPGAPLDDGLKILEAAEACPVEVIKFNKA